MLQGVHEIPVHPTNIDIALPFPSEVPVGTDVALTVRVSCAAGCDHRGLPLKVLQRDEVLGSSNLVVLRDGVNQTDG